MEIFIEWINQIVIFLILAAVIDMLIPNTKFEKYVRLVIGLIFILIFIRPVFLMFGTDITTEVNRLSDEIFHTQKSEETFGNSIEFKKREIESNQHAYILEQMAVQLENKVEQQLDKKHQVNIANLDFRFDDTNMPTEENLEEIIVYLTPTDETTIQEGKGAVKRVERVQIDRTEEHLPTDNRDIGLIREFLQEAWGVDEDKLTIYWEGGID